MTELSIETVLAEEATAIHGDVDPLLTELIRNKTPEARTPDGKKRGIAADSKEEWDETEPRHNSLYQSLNQLDSAALCLSGGGIRSAAFSLGVIQALATHPRPPPKVGLAPEVPEQDAMNVVARAEDFSLAKFHYLSTVSGGGYIGSWLSSWRLRADFATIWANLVRRPSGPNIEPATIAWLRSYSNYLTPKLGLLSADTWTATALYIRNLILNWLVILPVICAVLLVLKLLALILVGVAHLQDYYWILYLVAIAGALCLLVGLRFTTRHRPTLRPEVSLDDDKLQRADQAAFLRSDLALCVLSALLLTLFFELNAGIAIVAPHSKHVVMLVCAAAGAVIYALGWLATGPKWGPLPDFLLWAMAGMVYGALVGFGAYLYGRAPDSVWIFDDVLLPLLFGVPWILASQMLAEVIFVGLSSYQNNSDSDREWLGRATGWRLVTTLGWLVVTFFVFAGSLFVLNVFENLGSWVAPIGGVSGLITALLGKSSMSPGKGEPKGIKPFSANIVIAISAPIFAAALVVILSAGLDMLLQDESLVKSLQRASMQLGDPAWFSKFGWLASGLLIALVVGAVASYNININRFSLHAVYRNRLIRAFLGASSPKRNPNPFTGFDLADNPRVHELWPSKSATGTWPRTDPADWRPFHVLNLALNIVSARRLSWQERKAEPFTVSPLHSGSACKAFRSSHDYGDSHPPNGISLGTAMAISGAAASPNMGYHSSPAVTFLMAIFNVRLGWWLGNPGKEGDKTYTHDGPTWAIAPLLTETFGLTTDDRPYVYLSDGGHFENLGLYEMVRRRCQFIVAVDASCDPNYAFADLGNAVRKIALDLGVMIRFRGLEALMKRTDDGPDLGPRHPYHAVGQIDYPAADGGGQPGIILYIKPGYHGVEGAEVRSYATANRDFPHQGTVDQWFSESQFESYRALGFGITDGVLSEILVKLKDSEKPGLSEIFNALAATVSDARSERQR